MLLCCCCRLASPIRSAPQVQKIQGAESRVKDRLGSLAGLTGTLLAALLLHFLPALRGPAAALQAPA